MKNNTTALKGLLILFFLIYVSLFPVYATNQLTMSLDQKDDQEYRRNLFSDLKYVFKAPFHWKKKELLTVVAITGATAALYMNDAKIMKFVQSHRSRTTKAIARVVEKFGNQRYVIPGLAILYGYSKLFKDGEAEHIALTSAKSIVATQIVVYMFKLLAHRHRPNEGDGTPNRFDGPRFSFKHLSFCSGHSAMAFTLATVIATRLKTSAAGIIAYGGAALTALSRVHDKKHWASDILVGSVIGYVIARRITRRKTPSVESAYRKPQSIPILVFPRAGISIGLQF